jgi:type VII secretion protein EccE
MMSSDGAGDDPAEGSIVTEPATGVRAVARVTAPADQPPGPARIAPVRRAGQFAGVHILQVLFIEVLIVAAVALLGHGPMAATLGIVAAVALIGVTLARQGGRWWMEHWAMTRRFRRRGAAPAKAPVTDPLAYLRTLAPGLSIVELSMGPVPPADGAADGYGPSALDEATAPMPALGPAPTLAVARDAAGWFAVVQVQPEATMVAEAEATVPLTRLVRTLSGTGQAGLLLQVVTRSGPGVGGVARGDGPAARSYRDLTTAIRHAQAPAERVCWLAIRLDAYALAGAGADDEAAQRAPEVVCALVRLVVRTLSHTGLRADPLDRAALQRALLESCGLDDPALAARETWQGWQTGDVSHVGYWIRDWPAPDRVSSLLRAIEAAAPGTRTTVATVIAVPPPHYLDQEDEAAGVAPADAQIRCVIRISAPERLVDAAHAVVLQCADEHRAGLQRLDGEHGPAVYATAPTGGGAW